MRGSALVIGGVMAAVTVGTYFTLELLYGGDEKAKVEVSGPDASEVFSGSSDAKLSADSVPSSQTSDAGDSLEDRVRAAARAAAEKTAAKAAADTSTALVEAELY